MAHTIHFDDLPATERDAALQVLDVLDHGINAVRTTVIAALAHTDTTTYAGATLWLSGTSAVHAEAGALSSAAAAGDPDVHSLYLARRRADGADPGYVPPCGQCCQLITDLATYTGRPITLYCLNERRDVVQVIEHRELLPYAYSSLGLRSVAANRFGTSL